jgi:dihydroorotase-like cyclic amidohydrolase
MTNREFFTNITNGIITDLEKEHAQTALAKLDAALEQRKNKVSPKEAEKAAADAAIRETIFAAITELPQVEAELAAAAGVTGPKARAELRKLVAEGRVVSVDVKVAGKGKCKGYALPSPVAADEAQADA